MSRRSVTALMVALLSAPVILLSAAPAWAHIELVGSDPADGTRQREAPDAITLDFSEPVALRFTTVLLRVNGADAGNVDVRTPNARQLRVTVPDTVTTGSRATTWTLSFRTTSVDGHPVEGDIAFSVAAADVAPEPTESTESAAAIPTEEPVDPTQAPSTAPTSQSGAAAAPDRDDPNPWIATGVIGLLAVAGTGGVIWMLMRRRPEDSE